MKRSRNRRKHPSRKPRSARSPAEKQTAQDVAGYTWTVSALDGLQDIVREELTRRVGRDCKFLKHPRADEIHFEYSGSYKRLLTLRTAQTLLLRRDFHVSRPRTLLSPEHLTALTELIRTAESVGGPPPPIAFRFDAAGSDSPTMLRIAEQLETRLGIPRSQEKGDCLVVLRPGKPGWEVLCRVGCRPLATRHWRKVNYQGGLNAAIAACMIELTRPKPGDRYLNLMCGSGTLLIERLLRQRVGAAVGIDISGKAIKACRENTEAAGLSDHIQYIRGDATSIRLPDTSFDVVTADLPYGEEHGSPESNTSLYRDVLMEASRLCRSGGRMTLLTQDLLAFTSVLPDVEADWAIVNERRITQREYRPLCVTLRKKRR